MAVGFLFINFYVDEAFAGEGGAGDERGDENSDSEFG